PDISVSDIFQLSPQVFNGQVPVPSQLRNSPFRTPFTHQNPPTPNVSNGRLDLTRSASTISSSSLLTPGGSGDYHVPVPFKQQLEIGGQPFCLSGSPVVLAQGIQAC